MQIYGYGEDALTFWALKNKVGAILQVLSDPSDPSTCQIFFRPSFGRSGGESSSQFGEFDFIILSEICLYLGESKWDRSSEKLEGGVLRLRTEQKHRHDVFRFYVEEWAFGSYSSWQEFTGRATLQLNGFEKPLAPENSLLASNLQTVSRVIREHFTSLPQIRNVLLYLYNGTVEKPLPQRASEGFELVLVDYSEATFDNFIKIEL